MSQKLPLKFGLNQSPNKFNMEKNDLIKKDLKKIKRVYLKRKEKGKSKAAHVSSL